jgi:catechol 2,3-dioxygenase-like lactoylglutathione lyase family enzyme
MIPRPNLTFHSTAAFVRDIEIAKKFYTEVLGLAIELDFGKNIILQGGITFWEITPGHIIPERLGLDALSDQRANRFEFYFETAALDAVYARVWASGAEFLHPLHEEPWGQRTIRFFDPDRHLIEIGETLATFVKRLYNNKLTPEQVSQKTSIPLAKVKELLGA